MQSLRTGLRIRSVISVNYHYITVLCPFNLLIRFKYYNTYQTNLNKYKSVYFTCFVNKIEIQAIFFIFNTNPRFSPFLLYVRCKSGVTFIRRSFRDVTHQWRQRQVRHITSMWRKRMQYMKITLQRLVPYSKLQFLSPSKQIVRTVVNVL